METAPSPQVEAATQAYLATIPADLRSRSDAYTEGGYWLVLWDLVVAALVTWLIVRWRVLEKANSAVGRKRPRLVLASFAVTAIYLVVYYVLTLLWSIYVDFWREHQYALSSQPFGDWFGQSLLQLAVSVLLLGVVGAAVYALIRRSARRWWAWGGAVSGVFMLGFMLIAPVFIMPLFNEFKPFPPGEARTEIERIAQRGEVPLDRIFMFDGSRQRTVVTANVAGILGTARIAVSDVAVQEANLAEVRAVVGHEMGHYVLGHAYRSAIVTALLMLIGFYVVHRSYPWFLRRFGAPQELTDIRNPAGVPVLMFVIMLVSTLVTPLRNTVTRLGETEADNYSLATVREPDGLASALIKTVEYRKASPGPVAEFLFHTHPSVENRVRNAMAWKQAAGSAPTP